MRRSTSVFAVGCSAAAAIAARTHAATNAHPPSDAGDTGRKEGNDQLLQDATLPRTQSTIILVIASAAADTDTTLNDLND
jgi:Spy/CpxP family protein refolding chaperone